MDPQYPLLNSITVSRPSESTYYPSINTPSRIPYIIPTLGENIRPIAPARVSISHPFQTLPQDNSMGDRNLESDSGSSSESKSQKSSSGTPPNTMQKVVWAAIQVGLHVNEIQPQLTADQIQSLTGGMHNTPNASLNTHEQAARRNSTLGQSGAPIQAQPEPAAAQRKEPAPSGHNLSTPTASAIRLILTGLGVFEYSQDPHVSLEHKQQYFKACQFFNELIAFNFAVIHHWALAKFKTKKDAMELECIKWIVTEQTLLAFYASLQKNMDQLKTSPQREFLYIKTLLFSIIKGMMIIDRHLHSTPLELNCLPQFQEYERLPQLRECKIPSSTPYTIFTETLKKYPQLGQYLKISSLDIAYDDLFVNLNVPAAASLSLYMELMRKILNPHEKQLPQQEQKNDTRLLTLAMACATVFAIRKGPISEPEQSLSPEKMHQQTIQMKRFSILIADCLLGSQKAKDFLEQIKNPENTIIKTLYAKEKEKNNITYEAYFDQLKQNAERTISLAPQILQKYFKESDPKTLAEKIGTNLKIKQCEKLTNHQVFIHYFRSLMHIFFI